MCLFARLCVCAHLSRVYVRSPNDTTHHVLSTRDPGPNGETLCWYQCTIKGGREGRDVDVLQLVRACEGAVDRTARPRLRKPTGGLYGVWHTDLGAGEIMLNCIDKDGTNSGFDLDLIAAVKAAVRIPVIGPC